MRRPIKGQWGDPLLRMEETETALRLLIEARNAARAAGAVQTLARIEHAISSAKGAVRNAAGRYYRWREQFPPLTDRIAAARSQEPTGPERSADVPPR